MIPKIVDDDTIRTIVVNGPQICTFANGLVILTTTEIRPTLDAGGQGATQEGQAVVSGRLTMTPHQAALTIQSLQATLDQIKQAASAPAQSIHSNTRN